MNAENRCPQCNAELAANAPRGLCPACLLKGGLGTQTGVSGGGDPTEGAEFVPPTPAELTPHFPDLEILELVGRGGMGVVYKARQKRLDRLVALKILSLKIGQDPAFAERFEREARAMAMLSHPHIVAVYDFGQTSSPLARSGRGAGDEGGLPSKGAGTLYYFLMEFVDGVNLRRLLDTGKLAPKEALAIVPQICDALQYAHDAGVVHRDIKPENILLAKSGQVKIADFGLAKLMGREAKDFTLTGAGQVMGTPHYMAPEQFEHPLEVDHRADIYSLGVVFYQMLTGELPIGRFASPSKKVQIDVRLDEVVLRSLEKEPERRYQQASEIKTRVETIVTTPPSGQPMLPIVGDDAIELARRQVKGPAIGLLVVGILNCVAVVLSLLAAFFLSRTVLAEPNGGLQRYFSINAGPFGVTSNEPSTFFGVAAITLSLVALCLSSLIIFAALKMKRLQAYRLAIAASILAIISGNLIGLAVGIWALVVLSQRQVRAAFGDNRHMKHGRLSAPATGKEKVIGITALVLCLSGFPLTLLLAVLAGRNWSLWTFLSLVFSVILVAFLSGIFGWKSIAGKAAVIISSLCLLVALTLLGIVVYYESPRVLHDFGALPSITSLPPAMSDRAASVLRVRTDAERATIEAQLDAGQELRLFVGQESLGWSASLPKARAVMASVEASSRLRMEDGSFGKGFVFHVGEVTFNVAITPDGPVPFGELVFRDTENISQKDGVLTFADIHQADGTLVPVSVRVRTKSTVSVTEGPLHVSPLPAGWKLKYNGTNGIDFYTITPREQGSGLLMFSRWPPPSKPEDIPALVRQIADGFVKDAKKSPGVTLTSEKYKVEPFAGDHCKGSYAIFQLNGAGIQAMFMMSVDGQTWNGQFTGNTDDWSEALRLLKTIRGRTPVRLHPTSRGAK